MTTTAVARLTTTDVSVAADAAAVLKKHARSFAWAAPFLQRADRTDAAILYAFCRTVDDIADDIPDTDAARADARAELARVVDELTGVRSPRPFVGAYREVAARRGIPPSIALDLIAGMAGDLDFQVPADDDALDVYCYRAAGTVGLMMCAVMGAAPGGAEAAKSLGMAMQLTNIARDVDEDARRRRVYLPEGRLAAQGTTSAAVIAGERSGAVLAVVHALLERADVFYAAADAGLALLPWRARIATLVAGRLYRSIGLAVRARGRAALTERAYVAARGKVAIVIGALWAALRGRGVIG